MAGDIGSGPDVRLENPGAAGGAVAVGRFGFGARPGELARASIDPRGWLKAQITPAGADQPPGSLPASRDRWAVYMAFRAETHGC